MDELRAALLRILQLDPNVDADEGFNEWGEAQCFRKAAAIAAEALGPVESHYVAHADDGRVAAGPLSEKGAHAWIDGMSAYIVDAKAKYDVRVGVFQGWKLLDEETV